VFPSCGLGFHRLREEISAPREAESAAGGQATIPIAFFFFFGRLPVICFDRRHAGDSTRRIRLSPSGRCTREPLFLPSFSLPRGVDLVFPPLGIDTNRQDSTPPIPLNSVECPPFFFPFPPLPPPIALNEFSKLFINLAGSSFRAFEERRRPLPFFFPSRPSYAPRGGDGPTASSLLLDREAGDFFFFSSPARHPFL